MAKAGDPLMPSSWTWTATKLSTTTTITLFILANLQIQNVISKKSNEQRDANLKYILLWTPYSTSPFSYWSLGQQDFIKSECPVTNCYITNSTQVVNGDITKIDAVVFNGRNLKYYRKSQFPRDRSNHQKYVFLSMESSDNQPICSSMFDNFFNWTATYKLTSDIIFSYMYIKNKAGDEIGPRTTMSWIDQVSPANETFEYTLQKKTKAVAWFVSHCKTRSRREKYAEELKKSLTNYNLTLDIYGRCGPKKCSKSNRSKCQDLLRTTYYFYLSFENSFAEDYITEKALTPLLSDTAPILYGGANYSRFFPPGSYLDANKHTPGEIAATIAHLIATPPEYQKMFWWKSHYTYHKPNYVCRLCMALNDQTKTSTETVYRDFRSWWNRDHVKRCKNKKWGA